MIALKKSSPIGAQIKTVGENSIPRKKQFHPKIQASNTPALSCSKDSPLLKQLDCESNKDREHASVNVIKLSFTKTTHETNTL
ncbi:hypothetical protein VDG1235_1931 [Verrucomicrobiia bacterium DG1235]|nr:hypothetical protein VDG1235_1931 [Verrucomicrobiae bacterium DG1235]